LSDETLLQWRGIEEEKVDSEDEMDDDEVEWGGFAD
jgi:hypothetical protein